MNTEIAFQSTSLSRGKTLTTAKATRLLIFQSTSLSRGKTFDAQTQEDKKWLSIHFPLTREDIKTADMLKAIGLSIHFPLTREDYMRLKQNNADILSIHFPLTREDG